MKIMKKIFYVFASAALLTIVSCNGSLNTNNDAGKAYISFEANLSRAVVSPDTIDEAAVNKIELTIDSIAEDGSLSPVSFEDNTWDSLEDFRKTSLEVEPGKYNFYLNIYAEGALSDLKKVQSGKIENKEIVAGNNTLLFSTSYVDKGELYLTWGCENTSDSPCPANHAYGHIQKGTNSEDGYYFVLEKEDIDGKRVFSFKMPEIDAGNYVLDVWFYDDKYNNRDQGKNLLASDHVLVQINGYKTEKHFEVNIYNEYRDGNDIIPTEGSLSGENGLVNIQIEEAGGRLFMNEALFTLFAKDADDQLVESSANDWTIKVLYSGTDVGEFLGKPVHELVADNENPGKLKLSLKDLECGGYYQIFASLNKNGFVSSKTVDVLIEDMDVVRFDYSAEGADFNEINNTITEKITAGSTPVYLGLSGALTVEQFTELCNLVNYSNVTLEVDLGYITGITEIGHAAFTNPKIVALRLPDTVTTLYTGAFFVSGNDNMLNIRTIYLPAGLQKIEPLYRHQACPGSRNPFVFCKNLERIVLCGSEEELQNSTYHTMNDNTILVGPIGITATDPTNYELTIGKTLSNAIIAVASLGMNDIDIDLSSEEFSEIDGIVDGAFQTHLNSFTLDFGNADPKPYVGMYAFHQLAVNTLQVNEEIIQPYAFSMLEANNLIIGSSVKAIGSHAFDNAIVKNITFEDKENWYKESDTLDASVWDTYIADGWNGDLESKLEQVTIEAGKSFEESLDDYLFSRCKALYKKTN